MSLIKIKPESYDVASKRVRDERDKLLLESDWSQVLDAPVDKESWAAYRKSLRDLPSQDGFPFSVSFPSKPN